MNGVKTEKEPVMKMKGEATILLGKLIFSIELIHIMTLICRKARKLC